MVMFVFSVGVGIGSVCVGTWVVGSVGRGLGLAGAGGGWRGGGLL